ncbi:hypothetical protein K469DRAFT_709984 [Zopfia rhizophila CBS 207.26]|uniref:Uncharacterized protein n=1 Tax=Zopfia rhizophila CBS 207.26 TaxID=1314779 RepID=A0A6A6DZ71_9PEZI|nr:hypothetical protein K469DRAFT_709984 [Zopfia rhizophila CBS 207.26]
MRERPFSVKSRISAGSPPLSHSCYRKRLAEYEKDFWPLMLIIAFHWPEHLPKFWEQAVRHLQPGLGNDSTLEQAVCGLSILLPGVEDRLQGPSTLLPAFPLRVTDSVDLGRSAGGASSRVPTRPGGHAAMRGMEGDGASAMPGKPNGKVTKRNGADDPNAAWPPALIPLATENATRLEILVRRF